MLSAARTVRVPILVAFTAFEEVDHTTCVIENRQSIWHVSETGAIAFHTDGTAHLLGWYFDWFVAKMEKIALSCLNTFVPLYPVLSAVADHSVIESLLDIVGPGQWFNISPSARFYIEDDGAIVMFADQTAVILGSYADLALSHLGLNLFNAGPSDSARATWPVNVTL